MNCLHIYNYIDTHSLESNTFYLATAANDIVTNVLFGFVLVFLTVVFVMTYIVVHTCMSIFNLIVKLKTLLLHTFVRTTLVWILKQTRNLFVFLDSSLINSSLHGRVYAHGSL